MNRSFFFSIVGIGAIAGITIADAQLKIQQPVLKDPVTGLDGDQWVEMMQNEINSNSLKGVPWIVMLNATGRLIEEVKCGSYQLVGNKPYNKEGAPPVLPEWKATFVNTKSFDGYCRVPGSLVGASSNDTYVGKLNNRDGNFTNASFVIFMRPER